MSVVRILNSPEDTLFQRFEAKYWITEAVGESIRRFIASYTIPDSHSGPQGSYSIHSLYLDTPDLAFYRSSASGERNRFKLRLRSYSASPEAPVFFEVKRRVDKVICKERAVVRREFVPQLLRGRCYDKQALHRATGRELAALFRFRTFMEEFGAVPRCGVVYDRESYFGAAGESIRISFDRRVACLPVEDYTPAVWRSGTHWHALDRMPCIMEVKFSGALPGWAADLIRHFEMQRISVAKYVYAVDVLRAHGISLSGRLTRVRA